MVQLIISVRNDLGLHARAAAQLVQAAKRFRSNLRLERTDRQASADAKSILSVLMLAATGGTELRAIAEGVDEQEAISALAQLFEEGFGEIKPAPEVSISRPDEMRWHGLSVSEGLVVGRVLRILNGSRQVYRARIDAADVERELRRFRAAVRLVRRQLHAIKRRAEEVLGRDHAYIFDAHLLLLEDRKLNSEIESHISDQQSNAEWAVKVAGDQLLSAYGEIEDEYLRERGSDIEDVLQRVLVALGGERAQYREVSADAVIVSEDLLPSAVAELDLQHTRAIATDAGGWTSHTAIMARALGIPAIVGLRNLYQHARTGDEIIVDSFTGEVVLHPAPATLAQYQSDAAKLVGIRPAEPLRETGSLKTTDGVGVLLRANVELPAEFEGVRKFGAQGIGLYRSEFLLARPGVMFSEEEQYRAYAEVARLAGENGAVVRLFDLGGDKSGDSIVDTERNPALGLRAIRFGLRHESVMRIQVRAISRAAAAGRLDIVLPMVADVGDVLRAKKIISEEQEKLKNEGEAFRPVRIGAMIEVPSAALTADKLARVVDFFELGTNDLVQYLLAVDRSNDQVAEWFRSLHPAVLQSIARTLQAADAANIPAIVCGEMASTPAYAVLLIGLGANELSMTPSAIPRVRRVLAGIDSRDAACIAAACLQCQTPDEVEDLVREQFKSRWPELFPSARSLPSPRRGS